MKFEENQCPQTISFYKQRQSVRLLGQRYQLHAGNDVIEMDTITDM